jgi:hypothetical protein
VVTLEGLPFNSSMISFHILALQKIDTYIAKQCSHVEFPINQSIMLIGFKNFEGGLFNIS